MRQFQSEDENPLDICELRLDSRGEDGTFIHSALVFGSINLDLDKSSYEIGVTSATVEMYLEGLRTKIGSHIGTVNTIATQSKRGGTNITNSKKSIALTAILSAKTTGEATANLSKAQAQTTEQQDQADFSHPGIRKLPGDRWIIEQPIGSQEMLETNVLSGEKICEIQFIPHSNRYRIEIIVNCRNTEFRFSKVGVSRLRNHTKERLLQLVATKSLSGATRYSSATSSGITLSRATLEFEPDE